MTPKPLILPKKLLIAFSGIGIAMIIGLFFNAYQGMKVDETWLYLGIILNFVAFLAVVVDVVQNSPKNKWMWILLLATLSMLASFAYLVSRERILGIQE